MRSSICYCHVGIFGFKSVLLYRELDICTTSNDGTRMGNDYYAVLVGFNSILQIVLYAPSSFLCITKFVPSGLAKEQCQVEYGIVASSVGVFLGIPLAAALLICLVLRRFLGSNGYEQKFMREVSPWSLLGLILTVIILFASQGKHVILEFVDVARTAAPLICYFALTFSITLFSCRKLGFIYPLAVAQSFTASSNNFELAIAVD